MQKQSEIFKKMFSKTGYVFENFSLINMLTIKKFND